MRIIDVHAHLDDERFADDLEQVLLRAEQVGVCRMISVGTNAESSGRCVGLARRYPDRIRASVGIHPNRWAEAGDAEWERVCELAERPQVVAVGETGLDYHHEYTPKDEQKHGFRRHVELSQRTGKPLIIHARRSDDDAIALLAEFAGELTGVRHCFDRPGELMDRYLELGLHVSIGAAVTRPGYKKFKAAVRRLPAERLLVETDCPYQSPASRSGNRNEPAYIVETLKAIARLRETTVEDIADLTTRNARRLFGL